MTNQLSPTQFEAIRARTLKAVAELPRKLGRYQIRGELGYGGMGIVYDAYDPHLERAVAIKVIHSESLGSAGEGDGIVERFEREMRATSELFHPSIVAILDAGVEEDETGRHAYYVMERIEGDSLEERLRRCGTLTRGEGLRVAAAVARGLAAAHAHGLVHRDLKPSNILLPENGEPRVADFGLCRLRSDLAGEDSGAILGSAHYIAPEQLRSADVTATADLFSLGAILVRMFSGVEPFRASSLPAHFRRILDDEPDGLDALDADVRSLVEKLLAKDPNRRPASAADVAEELDRLATSPAPAPPEEGDGEWGPGAAALDSGPPPSRRASARSHLAIGAGVLVVAASLVMVGARNQLLALDTAAATEWKQVENQLARQHELIPKLVQITRHYTAYEAESLAAWREVRRGSDGGDPGERAQVAAQLDRVFSELLGVAERLPDLKADAHYRALAYEIAGTKNRIAVARTRYNEAVGALNQRLRQLPWSLAVGALKPRAYFNPTPEQMSEPALEL